MNKGKKKDRGCSRDPDPLLDLGRWLHLEEKPLRTTPPGRTDFVRVVVGDLGLTPSEDVARVDVALDGVAFVHCVGDLLAVGRVGRRRTRPSCSVLVLRVLPPLPTLIV